MGDPGRQLLEGDVGHGVQHVQVVRAGKALRHVHHAFAFKGHRVDGARGQQVIADRDSVPALLGGPATDPCAPGAVGAERLVDVAVVARQVVLGEEVDDERGAGDLTHSRLRWIPRIAVQHAVEIAAIAPRHVLVGKPLAGRPEVAIQLAPDDRLQLSQQLVCVHGGIDRSLRRRGLRRS